MRSKIAAGAAALVLTLSMSARAQEPSEADAAARVHFESGRAHFDSGNYELAMHEFQASWELSQRHALLYNLYVTAERLGQLDLAIDYLERYLDQGELENDRRAAFQRRLANLRVRRDRARTAEEEEESSEAPPSSGGGGDLLPAGIAFGIAGAGLLSFAITGGLALAEDDALANSCGATRSCTASDVSTLATLGAVADASWIVGAVAAATGVVLLVTLGLGDGSAETARVVPLVSPTLAGVGLQGSF